MVHDPVRFPQGSAWFRPLAVADVACLVAALSKVRPGPGQDGRGDAGHPARLGQITPIRCPGRRNRSNAPSGFPPAVRVRDFPPRAASAPLGDGPPAFNHRHSRSRDCRPDVLVVLDRRVRLRGQERGSSGVPSGTGKGRRRTLTRAAVTGTPAIRLTIPGLW